MSDKNKINAVVETLPGNASTVLQRIPSHHELMKVNRLLLTIICSLMVVILIAGFLLFPADSFISSYKKATATETYAAEMNPVLSSEVNALKGQLVGLVSGSIESKLNALEESIRVGSVASSIGAIEDLKNDLKVLRSYSEPAKKGKSDISNEQLMQEMSQLKRLIYLTIASCGLMLAAVAGIWIKNRNRLPYKEIKTSYLAKD
jgi:cell division protein FtsB